MTGNSRMQHTVESRVLEFATGVEFRLKPWFDKAAVSYPPAALTLIAIKDQKLLQVYAANPDQNFRAICSYPILAASGGLGPKLREGDRQVPEGIYEVESLNPNSRFHLALRVNYPNPFDVRKASEENRPRLGSNIMIHGSDSSTGCLAMGDPCATDLFVLAALTGIKSVNLIFTPIDFRTRNLPSLPQDAPMWLPELYANIRTAILEYSFANSVDFKSATLLE